MKYKFLSRSETDTVCAGKRIGENLRGGEIIVLDSDLGGGKTALTRGIALGLGAEDEVSSPTFTISQVYLGGKFEMHHYDLYRLGEMGLMSEELNEVLDMKDAVVVIEWPQLAKSTLPKQRVVHIKIDLQKEDENHRLLVFSYPAELEYVINRKVLEAGPC